VMKRYDAVEIFLLLLILVGVGTVVWLAVK
jgi:hypothetical protein